MGYASYLEDIRERLDQQAFVLRAALEDHSADSVRVRGQAQSLLDACERTLSQVEELTELVSDPHFDLAYEITQLDAEKASLQGEIEKLKVQRSRLLDHIGTLESDRKESKEELKRLKAEIVLRDKDFEELLRSNAAAAYEAYSTPAHLREAKQDEFDRD